MQQQSSRSDAALAVLACILVASCATYEAVVSAPPSFWFTLEDILRAVWTDFTNLIDLIL